MKTPRNSLLTGIVVLVSISLLLTFGRAAERIETTNRAGIKLSYTSEQKLTDLEVGQVLSLAQQIGITNVGSITLGTTIPVVSTIVVVNGKERVIGRNTSYESATIERLGWTSQERPAEALKAGDFWARASSKYTHFERKYEIAGTLRSVVMSENDVPVADKAIPLIAAKKVRFKRENMRSQFDGIDVLRPYHFNWNSSFNEHELRCAGVRTIIRFQMVEGEVLVTGLSHYVI